MMMEDTTPQELGLFPDICGVFATKESCTEPSWLEPLWRTLFIITLSHQTSIEIHQVKHEGIREYISQGSNRLDIASCGFNGLMIYAKFMGWNMDKVRIIGSIGAISLGTQLLLWFRLFDSLANYVALIFKTLSDVKPFMYVLGTIMLMFHTGFFLLQINRITSENIEEEPLYPYDGTK